MEREGDQAGLVGPANSKAVAAGLANADWYRTPAGRKLRKELLKRPAPCPSLHTAWREIIPAYLLVNQLPPGAGVAGGAKQAAEKYPHPRPGS